MSGRHRAARTAGGRSGSRPGSRAAPLAAGVGAVLLLVPTAGTTLAAWTDRSTVAGDGFTSGRLDLVVDGRTGLDTTHARPDLALEGMVPGESTAATLSVANGGDADLDWTPTVTTGGGLGPALTVELWLGGRASADDTTYPRTETCTGGTRLLPGRSVRADRGSTRDLCVLATLPTSTDDAYQGRTSGSVTVRLDATQVTTP
ncbi:hypothetical protein [uncultured Nocardioides sp.]|uniref:hypothetical protein n=1 Tax=uncultured Nocardioides sp. TaxID=198441 RepID=UPI002615905F|nr:hypothetical protein [uncultured Nocardioides sp.]